MRRLVIVALTLILLPLVFLGVSHTVAAFREARAEAAFPPTGQIIEIEGAAVHADIQGPRDGIPIVLIHGAGGNTRDFTFRFSGELAQRGYYVITFDRPGFGYSDPVEGSPASIAAQAARLAQAADALGVPKPIVLGHSLGGAVALAWATERPDGIAGLVAVSAVSHRWPGGVDALYHNTNASLGRLFLRPALAAFVTETYIKAVMDAVFEPQTVPEGYDTYFGAALTIRRSSIAVNAAERVALEENVAALVPFYDEIKAPALIVHGTEDIIVSAEIHSVPLERALEDAIYVPLDGGGHMPHHTHADIVLDEIDALAVRAGLK
ncbi:MAG: alpha/beta hydrolase [Pseudomonadota bacterium]